MDLFGGFIDSLKQAGTWAKGRATSLMTDPIGDMKNTLQKSANQLEQIGLLQQQAYGDKTNPLKVTNQEAQDKLLTSYLNSMMNFAPVGMTVWHGSPHKFDKFDASKIGTGEGAQAYGHGLYVAESPDVAMQYKDVLRDEFGIKKMQEKFAQMEDRLANWTGKGGPKRAERLENLTEAVKSRLNEKLTGDTNSLYKIDLPDEHIAKMLDWDKPFAEMSKESQDLVRKLGFGRSASTKGSDIYNSLAEAEGQAAAANALREAGIPGIRYLDGGSRGTGAGTSNFVIFPGNEGLLSILERNGVPIK